MRLFHKVLLLALVVALVPLLTAGSWIAFEASSSLREGALQVVYDALDSGASAADVYREIVEHALHEVGRLWAENRVSIGQEHYCTAITQLAIGRSTVERR